MTEDVNPDADTFVYISNGKIGPGVTSSDIEKINNLIKKY
jgi:hypothetical protein